MHNEAHFHRRNLPHIYIPNSTYFITSRLKGSISEKQIEELRAWKRYQKQAKNKSETEQDLERKALLIEIAEMKSPDNVTRKANKK